MEKDWRLNERHYGALTGLNKAEVAAKYGDDQVKIWRRSYDIPLAAGRYASAGRLTSPAIAATPGSIYAGHREPEDDAGRVQPYWDQADRAQP